MVGDTRHGGPRPTGAPTKGGGGRRGQGIESTAWRSTNERGEQAESERVSHLASSRSSAGGCRRIRSDPEPAAGRQASDRPPHTPRTARVSRQPARVSTPSRQVVGRLSRLLLLSPLPAGGRWRRRRVPLRSVGDVAQWTRHRTPRTRGAGHTERRTRAYSLVRARASACVRRRRWTPGQQPARARLNPRAAPVQHLATCGARAWRTRENGKRWQQMYKSYTLLTHSNSFFYRP